MAIPVHNLYYLLSYTWEKLESGAFADIDSIDFDQEVDLLAHMLIVGTQRLLRRGLDRGYQTYSRTIAGVRGQIDFDQSLKKMLFQHGRAQCRVDELTYDVLHNRLLKATLTMLGRVDGLDSKLRKQLRALVFEFHQVDDLPRLDPKLFHQIQLHRNNRFYLFLLNICELIARNLLVNQETGDVRFRDILKGDTNMPLLFEAFVRNFYKRELSGFRIHAPRIKWNAECDVFARELLPVMRTDIVLTGQDRTVIIDTKFYKETLSGKANKSVHSGHIYQIYSYLKNYDLAHECDKKVEGMLVYPVVGDRLRLDYKVDGHRLQVCTVDLAQEWRSIHEELIGLI